MKSKTADWHDRMYNNRALVPEHPAFLENWARMSAAARTTAKDAQIDLPYGDGPREVLDIFPAAASNAPVLVFVHGGYWRSLDKRDHSFIAPAFTQKGVCVVMPNYPLCPGTDGHPVTIPDIARRLVQALAWTWRHIADHGGDPSRITVAGHSAGGHLAAMLLACDWQSVALDLPTDLVRNALAISGLYDLRPLRKTPFLGDSLRLNEADAKRASPALWEAPARGELFAVVGDNESDEFLRQNMLIRAAWGAKRVPVCEALPGLHHFSVVDALANPAHALHGRAMELLQK
ncbi:MAG: esterase [Variovorax sp.]|nr:esterase [Variovorax sp.]